MVKEISLSGDRFPGLVALVDDEDFDAVNQFRWHVLPSRPKESPKVFYARRNITTYQDGRRIVRKQLLHVFLMGSAAKHDHADGNGLNNQRSNLRPATDSQNLQNRKKSRSNTSGYKGVVRHGNRWSARINKTWLGTFDTKEEAAQVYDQEARANHGEFACLNFPKAGERAA